MFLFYASRHARHPPGISLRSNLGHREDAHILGNPVYYLFGFLFRNFLIDHKYEATWSNIFLTLLLKWSKISDETIKTGMILNNVIRGYPSGCICKSIMKYPAILTINGNCLYFSTFIVINPVNKIQNIRIVNNNLYLDLVEYFKW